jgi:hypothetical protein
MRVQLFPLQQVPDHPLERDRKGLIRPGKNLADTLP